MSSGLSIAGYGCSKSIKSESEWGAMMEAILRIEKTPQVIQLVDIRHKPSAQDVQMYDYLKYFNLDGIVVATKLTKVSSISVKHLEEDFRYE